MPLASARAWVTKEVQSRVDRSAWAEIVEAGHTRLCGLPVPAWIDQQDT